MCGINGLYQNGAADQNKALVAKMNQLNAHRGPDFTDVFANDNVALGHNRLAIIDLDKKSNQPMHSNDGNLTLIFNGEIYNYKEVKNILKNYDFKTDGDTEVVLAAYEKWGAACLNHFNGMFAFAVWDHAKEELFIARDRMGIKPLYYFDNSNQFAFSSELRSLISLPFIDKKIDQNALVDYLEYGTVHAPRSIIKNVKMLLPGHYIKLNSDDIEFKQYWNVNIHHSSESNNQSLEKVQETIKDKFFKSVESRLVADVPFGAFLSGGIDSSAVVAAMSSMSDKKVSTFNISFNEGEFSEAKYAKQIAELYNTEHHEIKLDPTHFLKELPNAIASMDHPSMDGPNSYVVSKATKEAGITMALSGLGGDELFAGYDIFKRAASLSNKKWLISFPMILKRTLGKGLMTFKPSISSRKIKETLTSKYMELPYYYPINRQVFFRNEIHELLTYSDFPDNAVKEILQHGIGVKSPGQDVHFLSKVSYAEINTYMQNVLLRDTDQMSMAHALEVRTPFLDHNLVEYVYGINDNYKYPHSPKELLVKSLGNLLPDAIVNRPKMGFTFPWKEWIKGDLKPYVLEGIETLKSSSHFDAKGLDKLMDQFEKGHYSVQWSKVWQLAVLGHWMKINEVDFG